MRFLLILLAIAAPLYSAPPNVVMIISDDQAWTDYGFMGHAQVKTPNIDKLAAQSATFARGYVPASLCCPSLASIVTGRHPRDHKVTSNDPPIPDGMKPREFQQSAAFKEGREVYNRYMDAIPTLPRIMSQAGYLSLQTGKWWQGDYTRGGFTAGMTKGGRHGDQGLDIGRKTMQPIYDFVQDAKGKGKPFLVWYAPLLPHDPHTPPQRILDKYIPLTPSIHQARYWANVEWFDETVGDLMNYLDKEGLAENTLVVYVTDNGWIQNPNAPRYAERSKQSQYDGGLRTPIMLRWPGKIAPRKDSHFISSLDIFPTVLAACGLKAPEGLPGINLLDEAAIGARKTIFGDCYTHNSKDLKNPAASLRWRWAIRDGWKLIVPHAPNEAGEPELYNLNDDPMEARNLYSAEATRAAELMNELDAWWKP